MIYLDNNATTRVADEVLAAMEPYYREWFGNAHSVHDLGRKAHDGVEDARRSVAALIAADPAETIFTSCGTEGNAMVIRGLLDSGATRRKIVATSVEHPSVLSLLRALERAGHIELAIAPVTAEGAIDLDAMRGIVDDKTLLVCVMQAQNETGVIHDVAGVAEIAHDAGALVHVDSVQAAGKIPVSMRELGADFLTISGHKFHAPKGVGALAIRKGLKVAPLWYGGGQELGMRSGTEPVPSIVGLGVAAEMARAAVGEFHRVGELRDRLEEEILGVRQLAAAQAPGSLLPQRATGQQAAPGTEISGSKVPHSNAIAISINGASQPRLANTASISFHDRSSDAIVRALDAAGVCTSAGAACHSGNVEPSATMKAMGKPVNQAIGTVRFSLSRYTAPKEIDRAIDAVRATLSSL
jgi:cysteine desulfurase